MGAAERTLTGDSCLHRGDQLCGVEARRLHEEGPAVPCVGWQHVVGLGDGVLREDDHGQILAECAKRQAEVDAAHLVWPEREVEQRDVYIEARGCGESFGRRAEGVQRSDLRPGLQSAREQRAEDGVVLDVDHAQPLLDLRHSACTSPLHRRPICGRREAERSRIG